MSTPLSPNRPCCPVCAQPLHIWATITDVIRAECTDCGWTWSE